MCTQLPVFTNHQYGPCTCSFNYGIRTIHINSRLLYAVFFTYTLLLAGYMHIDKKYKTRGSWISIKDLADPTCVITGGSRGLGSEIVQSLIKSIPNIRIVILDVVEPELKLQSWKEQIKFIKCDLSEDNAVEEAISFIKKTYGKVNVLINNAAIRGRFSRLADMPSNEIATIFHANVLSTIKLIQAFHPLKTEPNDFYYVVNVASALGILSPARASTYAATKAALISYHESWTYELLSENVMNVRTLLVLPGQMDTQMFQGFEPPRQFFAPVVKAPKLAKEIVACCIQGKRGEICKPFYVNFLRMFKCFPEMLIEKLRAFSKMDECLPLDEAK